MKGNRNHVKVPLQLGKASGGRETDATTNVGHRIKERITKLLGEDTHKGGPLRGKG